MKAKRGIILFVCFIVALLSWLLVQLSQTSDHVLILKTKVVGVPEQQGIRDKSSETITVHLRSNGWKLLTHSLSNKLDSIELDASIFELNKPFSSEIIKLSLQSQFADGIELTMIEPETFQINTYNRIIKKVPVKLTVAKNGWDGYFVSSEILFEPDSVTLIGDEEQLSKHKFARSGTIDVSDYTSVTTSTMKMDPIEEIKIIPNEITFEIDVKKYTEVSFDLDIELEECVSGSLSLVKNITRVSCMVPVDKYKDYSSADFKAIVDCKQEIMPESNLAMVTIAEKPDYIYNTRLDPSSVEFIVTK